MGHGLASSVLGFQAARFLLGGTQPVNFSAGVRAAAEWFPMRERALAPLALARAGSPGVALACVSLVFFGHGAWGNIILPTEVLPARAIGSVSGLGGCLGAAAGVVTQQIVARLAGAGAWTPLFLG